MIASLILTAALTIPVVTPDVVIPVVASKSAPIQSGVRDSIYTGEFFDPTYESKRQCIVRRESNGHYFSTNRAGGYYGAYQMTKPLAIGAAWMMRKELRKMYGFDNGTRISAELRATPANKWHRFYQDMAFWTVAGWKGQGSGLKHWRGGRFSC